MDTETYEQIHISSERSAIGQLPESRDDDPGRVLRQEPVGIELPQTVDLVVEDTVPAIKGATASQLKPATLETGLVVQVPPFINTGDMIRVNTETGEYLARA